MSLFFPVFLSKKGRLVHARTGAQSTILESDWHVVMLHAAWIAPGKTLLLVN